MRRTIHTFWLSILLALNSCLICQSHALAEQPVIANVSIDLSQWDPVKDGALGLNGEWAFFSPCTAASLFCRW